MATDVNKALGTISVDGKDMQSLATALSPDTRDKRMVLRVDGVDYDVPDALSQHLVTLVQRVSTGERLVVTPIDDELTTQQAANLIGVSRQYVVRMIDENKLPATFAGTHRRVTLQDALTFKKNRRANQRKKLDELAALTEQLVGYEELEQ